MEEKEDRAEQQAKAQLSSIGYMLAALSVDYARLEELKDEREELQEVVWDAWETVDDAYMDYRDPVDGDVSPDDLDTACDKLREAEEALYKFGREYGEELAELIGNAGDCESQEDAEQTIQEDPLSVQIRSGWYSPFDTPEPYEFEILLCTGGPAVRILGELNEHNEPSRAWLEYQDWGTPWMSYYEPGIGGTLLEYSRQFYFGE